MNRRPTELTSFAEALSTQRLELMAMSDTDVEQDHWSFFW